MITPRQAQKNIKVLAPNNEVHWLCEQELTFLQADICKANESGWKFEFNGELHDILPNGRIEWPYGFAVETENALMVIVGF